MTIRKCRQAFVLAGLTLFAGCQQQSLPTAPAELTSGIVIFEHANYMGASAYVTEDLKNLEDVKGPCVKTESSGETTTTKYVWGDCISSIRVAQGWRASAYRNDGYSGDRFDVTGDVPNLQLVPGDCSKGGFNDCISSIRLIRP